MNSEYSIITYDLEILEKMAANMGEYLDRKAIDWSIPGLHSPKLTIGGYLMRQHRLLTLKEMLNSEDRTRLASAKNTFDMALNERVVRFEARAHQELHARLREWMGHIRELGTPVLSELQLYAGIVDTRVVITALIEKLKDRPFQLGSGILPEIDALDNNLHARVDKHPFIWDTVWKPAYPQEKYWWLYCCPKGVN